MYILSKAVCGAKYSTISAADPNKSENQNVPLKPPSIDIVKKGKVDIFKYIEIFYNPTLEQI